MHPDTIVRQTGAAELDLRLWDVQVVYALCHTDTIVYVGRSRCLPRRLLQHRAETRYNFDRVLYWETEPVDLLRKERALQRYLRPVWNRYSKTGPLTRTDLRVLRDMGINPRQDQVIP